MHYLQRCFMFDQIGMATLCLNQLDAISGHHAKCAEYCFSCGRSFPRQ